MLQRLLVPNLVWRVGRVASSVRKIGMRCASILLRQRLVAQDSLVAIWHGEQSQLVPILKSCLDDDEPLTRQLTCLALMSIFEIIPGKLDMESSIVSLRSLMSVWPASGLFPIVYECVWLVLVPARGVNSTNHFLIAH